MVRIVALSGRTIAVAAAVLLVLGLSTAFPGVGVPPDAVPLQIQGTVVTSTGLPAPDARVFVYEGTDVNSLRADLKSDDQGQFTLTLNPAVSFFHEETGEPLTQVFRSYRILAFAFNEAGDREALHEFRTFLILPGDVQKSADWELELIPLPGSAVTHGHAAPGLMSEHDPDCQDVPYYVPCVYDKENLGDQLTKITELHTTAGAKSWFDFSISSAFMIEVATAWDGDWVNVEYSEGATWSEKTGGGITLPESETAGYELRSSFRYYHYWWKQTWCDPYGMSCGTEYWETVEATNFWGGMSKGSSVGGDNAQPSYVESRDDWAKGWTDPGGYFYIVQEQIVFWANAVGFTIEGFSVSLRSRIEAATESQYRWDFDENHQYPSYVEMIHYDRGTGAKVWYFTHRIAGPALSAVDQTTSSVKLEWSKFEGLDFYRYVFYYRQQGSSTWSFHSAVTDVNQLLGWFGGLASGTTYEFRMRVQENTFLLGDYSNIAQRTTSSPPPPPPPPDDGDDPPCDPSWPACPTGVPHGWAALGWATPPVLAAVVSVAVGFAFLDAVLGRRPKSGKDRDRQRDP